ncbi:MAG: DUF4129 domain-containing protein [Candidatus Dormibacteraeota bacterium]|nr:DUF4129 domain-containing protein [Candidatus Dormibacteraeota bacterium]
MRRSALAAALLAAAVTLVPTLRAAAAPPSCPALTYIAAIGSARDDLGATPARVQSAVSALTGLDGAYPNVDRVLQPVLDDLAVTPPALDDARARLGEMAAVLALPQRAGCDVDSGPALGDLHDVYASPVFANLDQKAQASLLDAIGSFINAVVSHLFGALGVGGSTLLGVGVLLAVISFIAWRVRGSLGGRRSQVAAEPAETGDDPALEWRRAESAAAAGEYREAVRRAFRSALLEVALRGRIPVEAAWTTRDLLHAARADSTLADALAAASTDFDSAWYSGRPVTETDWHSARVHCDALRRLARDSSHAAAA